MNRAILPAYWGRRERDLLPMRGGQLVGQNGAVAELTRRSANLEGEPFHSFVGALRYGGTGLGAATWPLAKLDLFANGLRIGPSTHWLGFVLSKWEARFEELTEVQAVGRSRLASYIRFRVGRYEVALFGSFNRPEVLRCLEELGLSVGLDPEPFRFFSSAT